MEALRKLRDQVARQQQAVLKQFGGGALGSFENLSLDEAELRQHHKIENLYTSTRSCKHFQRDVVRGLEGYIVTGSKQVEIGNKMAEDSRKYGAENTCTSSNSLTKASLNFSRARTQMAKEQEHLLRVYGTQVAEPLRALILGAPLEDARHLTQRYGRLHQEAEAQAFEVSKRRAKAKEVPGNIDNMSKLEAAETKLEDLKSNMKVLGKEAASAMLTVEVQQQKQTLQRLIAMVEAERIYHQRVAQILEQLEGEMVSERQRAEALPSISSPRRPPPTPVIENQMPPPPSYEEVNGISSSAAINGSSDSMEFFLGEAMHSFWAESDVELSLSAGDYIVVRKVSGTGWAEGECRGRSGWFPLEHIERRERVLASKILKFEHMRSVFWSTNPSTHFLLLLRTLAVPSPITFHLHQNLHLRQILHQNPSIENRALFQATASESPMDSIKNNDNINEFERIKEKEESPILQNSESSSLSPDLPPQPPEKPEPGDCCGNGCIPCVWDLYYEELEAYTRNLEE